MPLIELRSTFYFIGGVLCIISVNADVSTPNYAFLGIGGALIGLGLLVPRLLAYLVWPNAKANAKGTQEEITFRKHIEFEFLANEQTVSGRFNKSSSWKAEDAISVYYNPGKPKSYFRVAREPILLGLFFLVLGILVMMR